jgi:hypothetical protein
MGNARRGAACAVSVLDAFFSMWSKAKATFGQGTPQGGAQYDKSGVFQGLRSNLDAAAPGSRWTGRASAAYGAANTEHQRVLGELGGLDKRLAAHVDQSAQVVAAGRRDLDAVRKWVVDAAGSVPQNAAGERSKVFDLVKDVVGEAPGGSAVGGLGGFMKDFFIGSEPDMPGVDNVQARDMFPVQMHMAASLVADGAGDPQMRADVQQYLVNGEFQIPEQGGKPDYRGFYNAITSYLPTAGHDNVLNSMTDEYWRAYSGAITNAAPPK